MAKAPLAVDLDGTLLKVDTLHENLAGLAIHRPSAIPGLIWTLLTRGRAAFKKQVAETHALDVTTLPVREDFVAWLIQEASSGREIHLVSAAHQDIVIRMAERLGIFASCAGSDGSSNLKGETKARYLADRFPAGFSYAGDSHADLEVWKRCDSIVMAGANGTVARNAARLGKPVEATFPTERGWRPLLRQLRLHQWAKNILVFVPLLLAHRFHDWQAWLATVLAFLGLSIAASATYIINDLVDLAADRAHQTKRLRPLAAGSISIFHSVLLVPVMLVAGIACAMAASWLAAIALLAYLILTLSYSLRLKRIALLDTAILGLLFTLRLLIGCAAVFMLPSFWLLAFAVVFFFSLSVAKRQTEIVKKGGENADQVISGRGYRISDAPLTLSYGIATSVASLVILLLYTTNDVASALYHHPNWLWAIPLFLHFWLMRIWLLAHRGELHDDPIVFALKDRVSLFLGACCAVAFYLAL